MRLVRFLLSKLAFPSDNKKAEPAQGAETPEHLEALVERFEAYLTNSSLKPATVRNYVADVRGFVRWLQESHPLSLPGAEQFREYRDY